MREAATDDTQLRRLDRQGSLGELAYEALKDTMIRGAFPPGEKLTVRRVAGDLGVSTTPARDAITRLISEGALVNLGPKTVVVPVLTRATLDEVTKMRLALEGLAAQEAVANVGEAAAAEFEAIQVEINAAMDRADYQCVLARNKDFHFLLYGLSKMPRLVAVIETLWLRVGPSLNGLYPEYAINRLGVSNHQWAIRGLHDRDGATVRAAIENDIRDGYRRLTKSLGFDRADDVPG
ncbi:GntR family transcriptional regulator [Azospirillum sp. RWY-5-1]|uniref:GntR family transcriptional regulator n=1 Tax=Azospirillum oleiclasticum TaxID=2735135 RepID=A0ABX2THR8_9PROT|nr:GntR family transcriptional regulator [Azospirillum oleiclasticum]NYZ14358.1 GntR family transcriptional regulator [Azospirillum oleiclasticum]NYZ23290.1 GntR family transcriptional regulator [Azospirillum oleiclasticum]